MYHSTTVLTSLYHYLPDEILTLIFYELHDPTPFVQLSKRLYNFSQDACVRAHYFLTRYGPAQAMYHALGRGKVINKGVLDVRDLFCRCYERHLQSYLVHTPLLALQTL